MSRRSHTACFLHLIWSTYRRKQLLASKESRNKLLRFFIEHFKETEIRLVELFINPEHVHLLIELPMNMKIQDIVKLAKGSSSHWINQNNIIKVKFSWATGYGAFTVSKSNVNKVKKYIQNQQEHHQKTTFNEEYNKFLVKHGLGVGE